MRPITHALLSALVFAGSSAAQAGSLAPPVGPVAPTMLDLTAIEPRVILKSFFVAGAAVNTITAPGQYVATGDIIVPAGKHGILLELPPGVAGTVSIDLNGFEIRGQPGSLDGVRKAGAFTACNFNIQNGTIVGMGGDGAHIENTEEANLCVSVRQCGGDGMEFMGVPVVSGMAINQKAPPPGAGNIVKGMGGHCVRASGCGQVVIDLTVSDAALHGIFVENADRCDLSFDVSRCAGNGVIVTDCPQVQAIAIKGKGLPGGGAGRDLNRVAQCGGSGVFFSQCGDVEIAGLRVLDIGNGGGGLPPGASAVAFSTCGRVRIEDASIDDSGGHGFEFTDCEGASMVACSFTQIASDGIHAVSTTPLRASKGRWIEVDLRSPAGSGNLCGGHGIYASGLDGVSLNNGLIRACDGDGVHIVSAAGALDKFAQVRNFKVERCAGDGIEIECDDLQLEGCETRSNGGNGVYAKDIRKNITINLHHSQHNQGNGLLSDDSGVALRQQGKSTQVTRSNISNNRGAGIQLEVAGTLTMAAVEASGNDLEGCSLLCPSLLSAKEKIKQVKCRFSNNGFGTPDAAPGLLISGASSIVLEDVECSGNSSTGLVVADLERDGRLDLVTCSNNGEYGVRFTAFTGLPGGRVRARDLHCDGNAFDGLLFESTTGGEVADSTFSNNGAFGVRVLSFNHLVQRCTFSANTGGPVFAFLPGNTVAPIVDEGTTPTNCNPSANHVR